MYKKEDAIMTKGLAILSMIVLHLFCRKGVDVYGTPLIWINDTTPLVYIFGFFSEYCVALYSICVGYAQQLLFQERKFDYKNRISRVKKLMINYS